MNNQPLIIEVKNLNKSFNGRSTIINLNLNIKQGEIYGILGPNGSGKTTVLKMLCGLLTPDSGEGHCLGYNIFTQSCAIKRQVGYMPQNFGLYTDLTVYENLDFIAKIYKMNQLKLHINKILNLLNLTDKKYHITGNLSNQWKQRLALAGCLLHEPKLLILDTPTAGVDPKTRREFWDIIHQLSSHGITTLISTHYIDEAEHCSCLAYFSHGILLAQGTASDIIQRSRLITWSVIEDNLIPLAEKLKKLPGVEQVAFFGKRLHISGKNAILLKKSITSIRTPQQTWKKISANLEDILIHLVNQDKVIT